MNQDTSKIAAEADDIAEAIMANTRARFVHAFGVDEMTVHAHLSAAVFVDIARARSAQDVCARLENLIEEMGRIAEATRRNADIAAEMLLMMQKRA